MVQLIVIDRHFWPDTNPFAIMLKEIVGWMRETDAEVTVITAQPGCRPKLVTRPEPWFERLENGTKVYRLPLLPEKSGRYTRNFNYCLFSVLATMLFVVVALAALRQKRVCFTSTIPPIAQPLMLLIASKLTFTKFAFSVHDIYPDVRRKKGQDISTFHKVLTAIDCITLRHADRVIVLSEDMRQTLENRVCGRVRFQVLNNFPLVEMPAHNVIAPIQKRNLSIETAKFVFAGNLGRYQALEKLVDYFIHQAPPNATLTLLGEGALERKLKETVAASGTTKVKFSGWVPPEQLPELLAEYDFGIATLAPDLINYAFPSKILTYWNLGLPILTNVSPKSALAQRLSTEKLGVAVATEHIMDGVLDLISNKLNYCEGVKKYRQAPPSIAGVIHGLISQTISSMLEDPVFLS